MIVVTGMHRSGTSAVSMIMQGLGVDFGEHRHFYGADEWNPRGYFEREDVIDLNSRLVTGFPRTTGRVAALASQVLYLAPTSEERIARRGARLADELSELATRLGSIAVKDPRFCLTLPVWQPYVTRTVVCLRHPAEVVRSLERRQRVPRALAFRFWDRHARALLAQTQADRLYVDFGLLGGPSPEEELDRLVRFLRLDLSPAEAVQRFRDRHSAELRHFEATGDEDLPPRTAELWERLLQHRESPAA